jgi:hypothetical protein
MLTKVYGGTKTLEREGLCESCRQSRITRGARIDDEIIICNAGAVHPTRIPFKVVECTDYIDRRDASYMELLDQAWILRPATKRRAAGFVRSSELEAAEALKLRINLREID